MKIHIRTVGRLRSGPEHLLATQYRQRITWPLEVHEVEADRLHLCPLGAYGVALDERGEHWTSTQLATFIAHHQQDGTPHLVFFIGGADGLPPTVTRICQKKLALGRMTWPHLLVRGLLLEQLYRAQQILAGHPYHRG